jgi:hypothetical protein
MDARAILLRHLLKQAVLETALYRISWMVVTILLLSAAMHNLPIGPDRQNFGQVESGVQQSLLRLLP